VPENCYNYFYFLKKVDDGEKPLLGKILAKVFEPITWTYDHVASHDPPKKLNFDIILRVKAGGFNVFGEVTWGNVVECAGHVTFVGIFLPLFFSFFYCLTPFEEVWDKPGSIQD